MKALVIVLLLLCAGTTRPLAAGEEPAIRIAIVQVYDLEDLFNRSIAVQEKNKTVWAEYQASMKQAQEMENKEELSKDEEKKLNEIYEKMRVSEQKLEALRAEMLTEAIAKHCTGFQAVMQDVSKECLLAGKVEMIDVTLDMKQRIAKEAKIPVEIEKPAAPAADPGMMDKPAVEPKK